MISREVNPDIFSALISSIIGQQISTKAAITVEGRMLELLGEIKAENIEQTSLEEIKGCGMSLRKAGYIKDIALAYLEQTINFDHLHLLSDQEIIEELTKLKGVGEWTAEMLLIHSLERPDVLSYKDLGIRRGIMRLYGLEQLTKADFENYRKAYSPYSTVASLYLWEISKN